MNKKLIILILPLFLIFGCKDTKQSSSTSSAKNTEQSKQAKNDEIQDEGYRLRPLPKYIYDEIYKYSDYLDVIFEDLDFSMSQEDNKSIRSFLQNINLRRTPLIKKDCKPMGHVAFMKKGNPIIEADFFHSPGCYYFLFFDEKGAPLYSNAMSDLGIEFFNNLKNRNFKKATK